MKEEEKLQKKLHEFRIKYNAGAHHSEMDSYHYYNAVDAEESLNFHFKMMDKRGFQSQTVSVERFCPYSNRWIDESETLNRP